jgi:hypothetical protein
MDNDKQLYNDIIQRLHGAGEQTYQRYPHLQAPPGFKSAGVCAQHVLELFPDAASILVERAAGLRPMREAVIKSERNLILPSKEGELVFDVPARAIGDDGVLRINSPALYTDPYSGPVDLVVMGTYGFVSGNPELFDISNGNAAYRFDQMEQGLDNGFQLNGSVPRVAIAADCQELHPGEQPDYMFGPLWVHFVITPTRILELTTGEQAPFDEEEEVA